MSELMQVRLPSGEVIWTRVARQDTGPADVGFVDKIHDLDGLVEVIRGVTRSVHAGLANLQPRSTIVEFGVELSVKSGKLISVLAEASGKATLSIKLTWDQNDVTEIKMSSTEATCEAGA